MGLPKDWLRWLRAPLAPTAACDVVACRLLAQGAARGAAGSTSWQGWAALAGTALLIYGFGMGLNDWADRDRDRRRAPGRPLAAGRIGARAALAALLLLAAGAVALGGGPAGERGLVLSALGAAALYDLSLKAWLVPGALSMGAVRALNASVGVVPLWQAGIAPAWTLLAPLLVGCYSAGVTVLSTEEETPSPARTWWARGLAALAYAGASGLGCLAAGRLTLAALLVGSGSVLSLAFGRVPRPGPVKRQVLEMLLGLYLLAATLAGGVGDLLLEAAALGTAFLLVYLSQRAIRALR